MEPSGRQIPSLRGVARAAANDGPDRGLVRLRQAIKHKTS